VIARQVVLASSYQEAREELSRRNLDIDVSTLVRIATRMGERAVALREEALRRAREEELPAESPVAGKRIRISVDGGRARIRYTHRRGRRKKNGRHGFVLAWREPRLITVDVLDEEGEMDRAWKPLYEVTLGEADDVFTLLVGLLRLIGAYQAAQVVFVADGGRWIWERLEEMLVAAGIPRERVELVLDFYHACEHLWDAVRVCKNLGARQREALYRELRGQLLEEGGAVRVIERLRSLARGRRGKQVNKEIAYLEKHLSHMDYAALRRRAVPIGSGVVESGIRRVVNLRFKSAGMSWREDHLCPLLYLRAILKAGHWTDFIHAHLDERYWLPSALKPRRSADILPLRPTTTVPMEVRKVA
jgi:hypothetical protein